METVRRAGAELAYEIRGADGPMVVAHHPLLGNHTFLDSIGLADALVDAGFRVVLPVSVGHKPSSCPPEPSRYALSERVADVLAVAHAVGAETFGFLGYSMGSWIGTGLLATAPNRVSAAVLGGWDPIDGILTVGVTRDLLEATFPEIVPTMVSDPVLGPMLAHHDAAALTRCGLALFDDELPTLETLGASGVPLLMYCGADDPYHANMELASKQLGSELVTVDGDHIGGLADPATVEPVRRFLTTSMTPT